MLSLIVAAISECCVLVCHYLKNDRNCVKVVRKSVITAYYRHINIRIKQNAKQVQSAALNK